MLGVPGYLPTNMSETPRFLFGHERHCHVSTWDNIEGVSSRIHTLNVPAGIYPGVSDVPGYIPGHVQFRQFCYLDDQR